MSGDLAGPRGAYPHVRVGHGFAFLSGISSRKPDNSIVGAAVDAMGTMTLDIAVQTLAVLENVERVLRTIGLDCSDLVEATTFLVNMNDFGAYNRVWGEYLADVVEAPARTTVAVHQLPHPHLLIEIKAVAVLRTRGARP